MCRMHYLFWVLWLLIQICVVSADFCTNLDVGLTVCHSTECCGDYPYQHCCDTSKSWIIGVAIGSALCGLFIIGAIVALVCFFYQKQARNDRIVYPVEQPSYATAVAYTVHDPYIRFKLVQQSSQPSPVYPPEVSPQRTQQQEPILSEGLQSQPPAYGGLPGNHHVV